MQTSSNNRRVKPSTRRRTLLKKRTPAEKVLSALLQKKWLYRVIEQQPIGPYFADFWFPDFGLVVELDGGVHEHQISYDSVRERFISTRSVKYGDVWFEVIRFYNEMVIRYPQEVIVAIENALKNRVERIRLYGKKKMRVKSKDIFGRIIYVEKMRRGRDLRNLDRAMRIVKRKRHFLQPGHETAEARAVCDICNDVSLIASYEAKVAPVLNIK